MTSLMSLFDGSGGFPLAGAMHGIMPVYASEVAPYPIAVSKSHFPYMKHLGSVTEINGAELAPVDVVTFGSPCQDLSVAGLQKGIHDGARSNRAAKAWYAKPENAARQHENAHQRYVFLKNLRVCTQCGRARALMGRTLCEECIKISRMQHRKHRAKIGGDLTA